MLEACTLLLCLVCFSRSSLPTLTCCCVHCAYQTAETWFHAVFVYTEQLAASVEEESMGQAYES